jgi:hypothetical protein
MSSENQPRDKGCNITKTGLIHQGVVTAINIHASYVVSPNIIN